MVRILLVDDEPFIVQGLKAMIELGSGNCEVVGEAANGKEALAFLEHRDVDLIIADIQMPVMSGLELLEKIRDEKISDAYFVILSGYSDFQYAQQALRYKCMDYVLKPVKQEELERILRQVESLNRKREEQEAREQYWEQAMFSECMTAALYGEADVKMLQYLESHLPFSGAFRYVEFENRQPENEEDRKHKILCEACQRLAGDAWKACFVRERSRDTGMYRVGMLYFGKMAETVQKTEREFLEDFLERLETEEKVSAMAFAGVRVEGLEELEESRKTAEMVKSMSMFHEPSRIFWYEEEEKTYHSENVVLCKEILDGLIRAAEENHTEQIAQKAEELYGQMRNAGMDRQMIDMNLNYLLFGLVHLAVQQSDEVSREEVFSMVRENGFDFHTMRGNQENLEKFVCEYAEYLVRIRKNSSRGVLADVEKEISERYAENLTLKEMSGKFFVNSAYLGQLFKKKHGISFKEYLNNYRIEQAAELLLRTDMKIYEIAEKVGYHDLDYFINRFISAKGCTPSRFRKKAREEEE